MHLGSDFSEFRVHLGSQCGDFTTNLLELSSELVVQVFYFRGKLTAQLLGFGGQREAKFAVLDGQSFEGYGMLDGHVDDVVHAPLCAREANVGSFSRNSKLVKYFQGAEPGSEEGEAVAEGLAGRGDRVAVRRR